MSVTPGALVPLTQTFVQSGTTTAIALVGQVLNNGQTNFVGYDQGSADYLFTTSEANAKETTLADNMTYWVSEGKAPGGYLAITSSTDASSATQTGASTTGSSDSTSSAAVTSQLPLDTGSSSTGTTTSSGAAATTTSTKGNSAQKLSAGAYFSVALGLLAVLSL
ncbi:Hypothetical protein R9X50_00123400 [Acrodontium crateriforme]|uniref:Uncharacterized protein n=1 Tax=Acrodontium crateriforme TaxID=150365 RepID=A0AAQ3M0D2_9PEZI|nr:Hypothetical protein R9X50_00123400 [Acrodontium crateriforme]